MPRSLWNGAISFGLVHIPVALMAATHTGGVDFDWLDKRSMDPVGYKRVNKKTGKEVAKENIVKGVEYEKGRYVVISEAEIRAAHPEATQTIDLFAFIDREQIPLQNIDTPYYLAPQKRGEKVYALLRETLTSTGKVGLAHVIIRTRQHLAGLMVVDDALVLVLLRWPAQVHGLDTLDIPESAVKAKLSKAERDMARQLVEGMSSQWQPEDYHDTFEEQIMALVETKARKGKLEEVDVPEEVPERRSADVVDLTELLKRSLGAGKPAKAKDKAKAAPRRKSPKAS